MWVAKKIIKTPFETIMKPMKIQEDIEEVARLPVLSAIGKMYGCITTRSCRPLLRSRGR